MRKIYFFLLLPFMIFVYAEQTVILVAQPQQTPAPRTYVIKKQTRTVHINTKYPITHFVLNFLGIVNIIKGSSVQIPVINWFVGIGPRINYIRIVTGLGLIAASRLLHAYEQNREEEQEADQNA